MRRAPALFDRKLVEWQPKPQFIQFPEFVFPPPPANPVIAFRVARDLLRWPTAEPWAHPRFLPFPYFEQPAVPPVIRVLVGQDVLAWPAATPWADPRFLPFPYFVQEAPANPVIRFGSAAVMPIPVEWFARAQHLPFPFFQAAAVPPGEDADARPWQEGAPQWTNFIR